MNLDRVNSGKQIVDETNVIAEILLHGNSAKDEADKETDTLCYSCNYGYVHHLLSEGGDTIEVLVVTRHGLKTGSDIQSALP